MFQLSNFPIAAFSKLKPINIVLRGKILKYSRPRAYKPIHLFLSKIYEEKKAFCRTNEQLTETQSQKISKKLVILLTILAELQPYILNL
jgi:hypothetical protein